MILTIERQPLLSALTRACAIIPPKSVSAIFSHIHIGAQKDGLVVFRATNMDIETTITVEALVSEPGAITVEADRLLQIVRNASQGADFLLKMEDNRLQIKTGRAKFHLPTLSADIFPTFSQPEWEVQIDVDPAKLASMIERTKFAMADGRNLAFLFLSGVHFATHGDELHAFATQRQQMAFVKTDIPGGSILESGVTVPKGLLAEMLAICAASKSDVNLKFMNGRSGLSADNMSVVGKAVDGGYLDYIAMMKRMAEQPHKMQVDREGLIGAVKRIASVMSEIERGVRIDIPANGDAITLTGQGADGADSEDFVSAKIEGGDCVLGINADVIIPVLEALSGDIVVIGFKDREGPIRLTSPDDADSEMFMAQRRVR